MKTVFVDRDGVINQNRGDHVKRWEEFVFLPGAVEALADLTRHGLRVVVLTNQASINRGATTRRAVEEIHRRMVTTLEGSGAKIDAVFYCPHRPEEGCVCRKPRPGLLFRAARELGIELSQSYLVGDAITDLLAAARAGSRPILVLTGRGLGQFLSAGALELPDYRVALDLGDAVRRILIQEGMVGHGSRSCGDSAGGRSSR